MNRINNIRAVKQVLAVALLLCIMVPIMLMNGSAFASEPIHTINPEAESVSDNTPFTDVESDPTQEPVPTEPDSAEEPTPKAEPDPTEAPTPSEAPTPTEAPVPTEAVSPYKVTFGIPRNWLNGAAANIKIRVADKQNLGWQKVEVKIKSNDWLDVSERFVRAQDDKIDVEISENGKVIVRVTDLHGNEYTEDANIACFDREAPKVTAGIDDLLLHVETSDALSGVAGIQVNGLLFTTLENGVLNVRIEEVLMRYEKLAVRAFDYAGNFSEPVTLDNPYYAAPLPEITPTPTPMPTPTATAEPTATPKPTKKPNRDGNGEATSSPTATPASVLVPTADPNAQTTATATLIPITEYIPLGPGVPFKGQGNMNTLDMLYSAHTNKQFITVQTRNGETFFLVIDYDKPIDAEAELCETYFLNLVDERDLLALLSEDEMPTPTPEVIMVTPEPTAVPAATDQPTEQGKRSDSENSTALIALLAVVALAGGGVYVFMQSMNKKGKGRKKPVMDDYDFDDDEDEGDSSDKDE